jgi:hypothetical protein
MSSTAAAVIDLDSFRRRRQASDPAPRPAQVRRPNAVLMPFWVAWVPMWPVA